MPTFAVISMVNCELGGGLPAGTPTKTWAADAGAATTTSAMSRGARSF